MMNNYFYLRRNIVVMAIMLLAMFYADNAWAQMGVNLGTRNYFVDLIEESHRFNYLDNSGELTRSDLDTQGWPATDFHWIYDARPYGEWTGTLDDPEAYRVNYEGVYKASFTGKADISKGTPEAPLTVENVVYNSTTNTTTFDVVMGPKGDHHGLFFVSFTNTQRTPTSPIGSGITDLKVIRPGYDVNTTQRFTNAILDLLNSIDFAAHRHLGTQEINSWAPTYPVQTEWSERKLDTDASQGGMRGIPEKYGWSYEVIVELANTTQTDPWILIPIAASDDYISQLASFLKSNLNSGLTPNIELSNEVWNSIFPQYDYLEAWANDLGIGVNEAYGRRTAQAALIFESVYGAGSLNNDVKVVFAYHAPLLKWEVEPALTYVQNNFREPGTLFWTISRQLYFEYAGRKPTPSVPELISGFYDDIDSQTAADRTNEASRSDWVNAAAAWGIPGGVSSYEGGPHTPSGGSTTNLDNEITANRVPEMGDVMRYNVMDSWWDQGGGLAMQFTLNGNYSRWGCWGATDDLYFPDRNHKMQAVRDLVAASSGGNQSPTVSITSPADGATFSSGSSVSITASASDADGSVSQVDFYANGNLIGSDESAPYESTLSAASDGTYSLTAVATDDQGAQTTSSAVSITIGSSTEDSMISQIDLTFRTRGPHNDAYADVTITSGGAPLEGASVTVTWSGPVSATATQSTGSNGVASFEQRRYGSGTITITIDDVVLSGYVWDQSSSEVSASGSSSSGARLSQEGHIATQSEIVVYPNPANDRFSIKHQDQVLGVKAFDLIGKRVLLEPTSDQTYDIQSLQAGIYMLEVLTEQGTIHQRLIKK